MSALLLPLSASFLLALGLAAAFTPLAMRLAWATGFLDRPNTPLKTQSRTVAYLGGLAVAVSFGIAVLGIKFWLLPSEGFSPWPLGLEAGRGVYAIGLGSALALSLGLLDDKKALSPMAKLLGQVAGALVLVACGLRVRFIHPEALSVLVTVLWVVTVTNALNFIDIMDGLAASVSLAAALVFGAFAVHAGRQDDALAAAALAGACLGFLPYNWKPARIYLGDGGSHFLGFALAAISLNLSYSHQNQLAVFSPLAILALPLFDLALMVVIRLRKGIPPWKGSPDHVALRLKVLGFSAPAIGLVLSSGTLLLGALVYAGSFLSLGHALLLWAALGGLALLGAVWLMSIEMPQDKTRPSGRTAIRSRSKKRHA